MEVATSEVVPVAVVKTEPIEAAEAPVVNVAEAAKRRSFRLERIELAKARKAITDFGKSLRKTDVIPEKEAPLAASNVIANNDTDMAEDVSVNTVNVESLTTDEAIEMAEAAIAESDATIATNQKVIDEFDDETEFRLYRSEDDVIEDDDDDMIDNV